MTAVGAVSTEPRAFLSGQQRSSATSASRRRHTVVFALVVTAIAALLYFEYRTFSRVAATPATEADTLCVAARIGLSCQW